ncbi:hypothetical protein [Legionella sp. CNM-4043-24]|uniref:hypothetical protein n=1 Tax=Legionella sp. CNM-4043-24 TaxID=3421646 RepID=UPI00403B2077
MKTLILASTLSLSALMMSGCTVTESTYAPGYDTDYVYTTGYYGYRPVWGNSLYSGYRWRNNNWGAYSWRNNNWGYHRNYGGAWRARR